MNIYNFAKTGQLVLNKGMWKDQRIVSENWINKKTETQTMASPMANYGYQWWVFKDNENNVDIVSANGFGDQYLPIVPSINLLIVMNG